MESQLDYAIDDISEPESIVIRQRSLPPERSLIALAVFRAYSVSSKRKNNISTGAIIAASENNGTEKAALNGLSLI